MAVEVEGGGGRLVVGGGDLRFLYGWLRWFGKRSLVSSSNIFTSNCARLLILYIIYRRSQDTFRGFKFKLN